jgi:aminoglycoside phosphotransferase (APT) family kinase protein
MGAPQPMETLDLEALARRATAAARRVGVGSLVRDLERLPVGEASITLIGRLEREAEVASERIVLKSAPAGLPPVRNRDVLRQARVMRALRNKVPVPAILFEDEGSPPAVPPFFAMQHVDGDSVDPAWARDPQLPPALVEDRASALIRALGRLHNINISELAVDEREVILTAEVERWVRAFATADEDVREGVDDCISGLMKSVPTPMPTAVTHGDFRLGNCLWQGSELAAIIDWELWTPSDPRFDLAFVLFSFDGSRPAPWRPAAGAPSTERVLWNYAEGGGHPKIHALDWFVAAARFKVAASLSLLVKFNRRRSEPDPVLEACATAARRFVAEATDLVH